MKFAKRLLRLFLYCIIGFFVSSILIVLLYTFINPPVTPLMLIRCAQQITNGDDVVLKKDWVSIEEISPSLPLAVVASEDNLFLDHNGFDFKAIEKARDFNEKKKGKRVRGASTISQQTAKNVFLWPQRSYLRKGLEAYFTVLIELVWSKKRIMEVYLNVIEMGKGIYGAEAAAQTYYSTSAGKLSSSQSALIAAILPNPLKWSPAHPTGYLRNRQQWIQWNMGNIGALNY
jgi:monofunctional biosynthetic peptidoglycan transglycosylase